MQSDPITLVPTYVEQANYLHSLPFLSFGGYEAAPDLPILAESVETPVFRPEI